jgi:glutamate-5-semialdehyde dehydrogenase
MSVLEPLGRRARSAARALAQLPPARKNAALLAIADALIADSDAILAANALDVAAAEAVGTAPAIVDRMLLTAGRLAAIAADVRQVAALPDPVGEVYDARTLPSGLRLHKRRVPIGVIGAIYEARPNVTVDIAALCLKTGNAVILRGGSDIAQSVAVVTALISRVLAEQGLPAAAVQSITDPDRALVRELLRLDQYVDMIIPRGGYGLHRFCVENATVPVIVGGMGVGHIYVEPSAPIERVLPILINAKTQRPGACNTLDTLLIHHEAAAALLPAAAAAFSTAGVELRCDEASYALLAAQPQFADWRITAATPDDFGTEFLALIASVKIVASLDAALEHIAAYGGHTETILTDDRAAAERFTHEVDATAVFVNASPRFNDGAQFGLGAEVAISTNRLHARGPLGLQELTTYTWIGEGDYLVRA